jgi:ATP-dependent Clp protease ATP-binding subunit ClpC
LIREDEGIAARVLRSLGVELESTRERLPHGKGERRTSGQIMFLPPAKKALEAALDEADALNHPMIGTEHLLLGLVADSGTVAARLLTELGTSPSHVRKRVLAALSGE